MKQTKALTQSAVLIALALALSYTERFIPLQLVIPLPGVKLGLANVVTLVALYVFGVEAIREFAFPLIVGMLAGTYSSVLLSGQVWAIWMGKRRAKKA